MRRFVVLGQKATASPDFSLDDLPATSGRLDVLLRCTRAALLVSHGLRKDTVIYLVLMGGPRAPRTIRIDGRVAEYVRPDERALAGMAKKLLANAPPKEPGFAHETHGFAIAEGGLDAVIPDLGAFTPYVLEENANDLREAKLDLRDPVFFLGDHLGIDAATRARLEALGALAIGVGPVSVHADDVVAIVSNELDRRGGPTPPEPCPANTAGQTA